MATNSNVTPITAAQPAPAVRFHITATIDGYPIELEGETTNANNLRSLVEKLRSIGATPPQKLHDATSEQTNDDPPVCPYHSKMKPSKFGVWHCTAKMADGSYCKSKA